MQRGDRLTIALLQNIASRIRQTFVTEYVFRCAACIQQAGFTGLAVATPVECVRNLDRLGIGHVVT